MKPVDVAHRLNIGGSTVRAWSKEFAPFLSPTAVGGDNRRRDFTLQDVSILNVIKQMTDRNTPRDEIFAELTRLQSDDWRELPPIMGASNEDHAITTAPPSAVFQVERNALLREIATLQDATRELKSELAIERRDKEALLRELADLNGRLHAALKTIELYDSGRLQPPAK